MTSHEFRIGLTELSTTVIDFAAELKSQGRRLVIVYAPSKEETYADKLKAVGVPPLGILRFNDQIGELCERNGVEFLDLSSALEIEGRSGTPLYFLNDGHWTSRELGSRRQHLPLSLVTFRANSLAPNLGE